MSTRFHARSVRRRERGLPEDGSNRHCLTDRRRRFSHLRPSHCRIRFYLEFHSPPWWAIRGTENVRKILHFYAADTNNIHGTDDHMIAWGQDIRYYRTVNKLIFVFIPLLSNYYDYYVDRFSISNINVPIYVYYIYNYNNNVNVDVICNF